MHATVGRARVEVRAVRRPGDARNGARSRSPVPAEKRRCHSRAALERPDARSAVAARGGEAFAVGIHRELPHVVRAVRLDRPADQRVFRDVPHEDLSAPGAGHDATPIERERHAQEVDALGEGRAERCSRSGVVRLYHAVLCCGREPRSVG